MQALYDRKRTTASPDQRIALLAARQHGVFTRAQALGVDATEGTIRWRLHAGRWERLYPKVYRLAGAPETWRQQAIAACFHLGTGAVLCRRAAGVMRGLFPHQETRLAITVNNNRNRSTLHGVTIHATQDPIPTDDVTTVEGIPVTRPARTLLDLAAVEPQHIVERCIDDCLRRRLVSLPFLERWLADPRRTCHRGARVLGRLIAERATIGVTESPLETELLRSLTEAGLPIPKLQYELRDGGRFLGRIDFAYPEQMVGIEADGFAHHGGRDVFDDDRARGNEIESAGWRILRVTSKHLERDPGTVSEWVRRALERARA